MTYPGAGDEASTSRRKPPRPAPVINIVESDDDAGPADLTVAVIPTITYFPVGRQWQQMICELFGWQFVRQSSPVTEPVQIDLTRRPKVRRVRGDGNCYYRAISYIVTGSEDQWRGIKDAVLHLMLINVDLIIQHEAENPGYLLDLGHQPRRDRRVLTPRDKVTRYLERHAGDNVWADTLIIHFTGFLLKTRVELFLERRERRSDARWILNHADWSGIQREFLTYDVELPHATTEEALYVHHPDDHFDAACEGLVE